MRRPIAISLAPNMEKDDVLLSLKKIIDPFNYNNQSTRKDFEKEFSTLFGKKYKVFATRSGRGALYLILKSLGICNGDEVIVQAFTCSAAINPIIWNGAKPVYVDIDETYNMDPSLIEKKITGKTRAIIVQHTFGIPAEVNKIKEIANENNLLLIEDCAVSLGGTVDSKQVGTFGDIAFFSFGRDKIISSVWGGAVLTKDQKIIDKIENNYTDLTSPSNFWTFQQLLHPISFSIILPTYNFGRGKITLGKILLFSMQKLNLLSYPVSQMEKNAQKPGHIAQRIPGVLAELALNQLNKLDEYNKKRIKIAKIYDNKINNDEIDKPPMVEGSVWLRYTIRVSDAKSLIDFAKKRGILLGDWYKQSIYPINDLEILYYDQNCKNVERLKNKVVNLPTYPTMTSKDVDKVITVVSKWQRSK